MLYYKKIVINLNVFIIIIIINKFFKKLLFLLFFLMQKLHKLLERIDFLASPPNLNFNGKKNISSSISKFFSIVLILIMLFLLFFSTNGTGSNPQISYIFQYQKGKKIPKFNPLKELFAIKIGKNGQFNNNFKIYFEFFYFSQGKFKIHNKYEFVNCSNKHIEKFKEVKFNKELKSLNLNQLLCFPLNIEIPKSFNFLNENHNFLISIYKNSFNNSNNTLNKEINLHLYFEDNEFDEKNYKFERNLIENELALSLGKLDFFRIDMKENVINEDVGYFTKNVKISTFYNVDDVSEFNVEKSNRYFFYDEKYGMAVLSFRFIISKKKNIFNIKYMKFQEYFAQIFSIFNFLYYICLFLSKFTSKLKIRLVLIDKLYDLNNKNKNIEIEIEENSKDSILKKTSFPFKKKSVKFKPIKDFEVFEKLEGKKKDDLEGKKKVNLEGKKEGKINIKKEEKIEKKNKSEDEKISSWNFLNYWIFKRKKEENQVNKIIKEKFEIIEKKLDLAFIVEKIHEFDKLKILLFNKNELKLMKILPKQNIFNEGNKIQNYYSIIESNKILSQLEVNKCLEKKDKINKKLIKFIIK